MRGLGNHVKIANCMFLFLMGSNFFEGVVLELVHFSCLLLSPIRKKIQWHSVLMWIPTDTGHVESSHYINLSWHT